MIRVGGINATMRLGEREGDWLCHYLAFRAFSIAAIRSSLLVASVRSVPSRSEEHTSELQSLMRISYAVFCLKKKNTKPHVDRCRHQNTLLTMHDTRRDI